RDTGAVTWVLVRANPVFDAEGKVRMAITVLHDITPIMLAESELARRSEELAAILKTMDNALTVQDPQGRLVHANDAAARLLGFSTSEELLGTESAAIIERFEVLAGDGNPIRVEDLPGRRALRGESV